MEIFRASGSAVVFVSVRRATSWGTPSSGGASASRPPCARLYIFGRAHELTAGPARGPGRRLWISVAGPFVNIALGAACFGGAPAPSPPGRARSSGLVLHDFVWAAGFWVSSTWRPCSRSTEATPARPSSHGSRRGHGEQGARLVSTVTGFVAGRRSPSISAGCWAAQRRSGSAPRGGARLAPGAPAAPRRRRFCTPRVASCFRGRSRGAGRGDADLRSRPRPCPRRGHRRDADAGSSSTSPLVTPSEAPSPRQRPPAGPPLGRYRRRSGSRPSSSRWRCAVASAISRPPRVRSFGVGERRLARRQRGLGARLRATPRGGRRHVRRRGIRPRPRGGRGARARGGSCSARRGRCSLEREPDPDLAFAVARAWAGARATG